MSSAVRKGASTAGTLQGGNFPSPVEQASHLVPRSQPASQCDWILLDWVEGLITQAGKGTQKGTRISRIAVGEGHVSSYSWLSYIS